MSGFSGWVCDAHHNLRDSFHSSNLPQRQAEADASLENWVNKIASNGPKICIGSLQWAQSPPARIRADGQAWGVSLQPGPESQEPRC